MAHSTPAFRDRVQQARDLLIASLAALDERKPSDAWITGQRVRFLVDQGSATAAVEVARQCSAERVWCAQLLGFALHAAGDYRGADSAFDAATAAMSPKDRCKWISAELLLDEDGRSAYGHMNCDERLAANTRDLVDVDGRCSPIPPRTAAARTTRARCSIQLHSALPWDERYDWRKRFGGESVTEMMVRYGWPAFSAYAGDYEEESHASWMYFYDSTRTATAEYPQDRVHLVPQWNAIADPFRAPANAWQLNMPPISKNDEPARSGGPTSTTRPAAATSHSCASRP